MTYRDINLEKLIIYDIETMQNLFCACFRDYATGTKKQFVIYNHERYNGQAAAMYKFLRNCAKAGYTFLGFNNVAFDAQVLHYYYEWCSESDPLYDEETTDIIKHLYKKAQDLITLDESEKYKILVPEHKLFTVQIDLFKQLHFDRKKCSLKWAEFTLCMPNIQEMPIAHDENVEEYEVDSVVEYCWNDVESTLALFNKAKFETETRLQLSKDYELNLINSAEPKMVRDIFAKFICKEMDISYSELKQMKTIRADIALKDLLFPYTKFQTKAFNAVLDIFKAKVLDARPGSKDKFEHEFIFNGSKVALGLGGIHYCTTPGIYTPAEDELIEDADGTSFYPMLAIKNNLRPLHLGEAFNKVYPMMFAERQKYPKKDPRNYLFKIILNSCYGLSKEINSYLYDPVLTYGITLNGQLSLLMLAEALNMSVPGIMFIQMNTDGLTYKYKKQYEPIVRKICEWWQKTTQINLEYAYYSKMVIMDVSNYLAVSTKGDVKQKGLFKVDKAVHENPSSLIVPKALMEYFVNNLPIKEYISNPENSIFDYCNGTKRKSDFKLNLVRNYGHAEIIEPQQKVCRYIFSKPTEQSGMLVKDYHDGRRIAVEANNAVEVHNTIKGEFTQAKRYPLDLNYYIQQTNKIINLISPPTVQTKLF